MFCMRQVMASVASGKILLSKTIGLFHEKYSMFNRNFTYSLRSSCHWTCPLPQRVLLSKRTSRLYESYRSIELTWFHGIPRTDFRENPSWRVPSAYLCSTPSWRQLLPGCVLLLFEVPSLRVTSVCLGARCVSICDLLILGSSQASKRKFSTTFRDFFRALHDPQFLNSLGNVENNCSMTWNLYFWIALT